MGDEKSRSEQELAKVKLELNFAKQIKKQQKIVAAHAQRRKRIKEIWVLFKRTGIKDNLVMVLKLITEL